MNNKQGYRAPWIIVAVLVVGMLSSSMVSAHESRPAYLELTERDAGLFDVLWRRPARGDRVLALQPQLPGPCKPSSKVATYQLPGSVSQRWSVDCGDSGLVGHTVSIEGLSVTITDVLVRVDPADGLIQTQILRPNAPSFTIEESPAAFQIAVDYLVLGVEHILGGIDHLLFVLGLLLLVRGGWLLVKTVTAFTVAHSMTLGMATLGVVHVPQAPVEAVIALSILFLATELAKQHDGQRRLTQGYPWLVAFTFGLLHGFGFAGALSEVGLPQTEIPLALLMFNVGVEVGQLAFIGGALIVWQALKRAETNWVGWAPRAVAYGIGSVAAFWVIERVSGFW